MPHDPGWSPSGPAFQLQDGDYTAVIRAVGAGLQRLRWQGRDLVLPFADDELRPLYRGAVLAPWPNRVAGGRWTWRGDDQQLAITEPERGHALHGLVCWAEWAPAHSDGRSVVLTTTIRPQPGYPFHLELEARWSLDASAGLGCELRATNRGPSPAPYGCSIHPYLVAPTGPLDGWTLDLPASQELLVDDALIPTELVDVLPEHDFRSPRPIGTAQIDHAFTAVRFDGEDAGTSPPTDQTQVARPSDGAATASSGTGRAVVRVTDAMGTGASVTFDRTTPWVQVCTSDWPDLPGHRAAVAVEPMTCPPNALATGTDLVVLDPDEDHTAGWTLAAL